MTKDTEKPLSVSREDLYELAWSKPLRELAKDFGISEVALAKRCRWLAIPVPGRGYSARVDAGQQPYRPRLPKREPQRFDDRALTVGPSRDGSADHSIADPAAASDGGPSTAQLDEVWLQDRLAYEKQPDNAIPVPAITRKWDPTIQQCRDELEEAAEKLRASKKAADKAEKWPDWRKHTQVDGEGSAWRSVKDRGQRLWDTHRGVCFRVSLGTYKRALSIVNALALASPARGFTVREDEEQGRIVFAGHNAEVQLRLTEPIDPQARPRTRYDGKVEQEKYYVPTGRLRITLQIDYRAGPAYEDRDSRPLESQLNRVFCGIYRQVVRAWREEHKLQAFRRKLEEGARQRAEAARLQAERNRVLAKARARRRRLLAEVNRWAQTKRIEDYVAHIRISASERPNASGTLAAWMDWALRVAGDLDPTEGRLAQTAQGSKVDQQK
jgi:hypothetical protein